MKLESDDDIRALFRATVVSSVGCTLDKPIDVDAVIDAEKDIFPSDGDELSGGVIDVEEDIFASDGIDEQLDDYVSWTLDVEMHGGDAEAPGVEEEAVKQWPSDFASDGVDEQPDGYVSWMLDIEMCGGDTEVPGVDGAQEEDEMAEEVVKQWPSDFHAVDIVKGFAYCTHAMKSKKCTLKAAFEEFFPTTFASSTYNEHRHRWMDSPQAEKDKALAGRHSSAGLWSEFMKNNPARHAQVKKEKQKLQAACRCRDESESESESESGDESS